MNSLSMKPTRLWLLGCIAASAAAHWLVFSSVAVESAQSQAKQGSPTSAVQAVLSPTLPRSPEPGPSKDIVKDEPTKDAGQGKQAHAPVSTPRHNNSLAQRSTRSAVESLPQTEALPTELMPTFIFRGSATL